MQHNRILSNYPLIFGRQRRKSKLAYWGHGKNFQSKNPLGIRERIKRRLIQSVDWWFAYTSMSAEIVEKAGFAPDRITCLNNAIDTRGFRADLASVSAEEIKKAKQRFSISDKSYVGLFCGSIYPDKRPHIMIEIAAIMKANIPDFHFFVIGDGPSASVLAKFSSEYDWLHYLGVKKGREKALFFHLADVVLNPGSVGLHVLEAFAAGLPMVTMADAYHGPESCYLVDGYNGYMTEKSSAGCAARLMELYRDKATYRRICAQALLDAEKYTVEKMSARFIHGIENCLSLS